MADKQFPPALKLKEEDVQRLLACSSHLGTRNLDPAVARYIYKRRSDGVFIFNVQKIWEKIVLAARIIAAIENPADVCVIAGKPYSQRAVLKFAKYTGATAIAGRFTPGTFTNQSQEKFLEPRLFVISDPRTDSQALRESSYVNIPTIAFVNSDSSLGYVDVAIPCNNKSRISIGLLWWMLCREVLYLRNTPDLTRGQPWNVMVDLFIYRDPEEEKDQEQPLLEEPREEEQNAEIVSHEWEQTGQNWSAPQAEQWANVEGSINPPSWADGGEGSYE
jgi:small subunit ribosomal protein SAe